MIEGFVTCYKDKDKYIHLYFYPGVDDNGFPIYRDIDLTNCTFRYTIIKHFDNAVDYKFYDRRIYKLNCKLLDFNDKEHFQILMVD